MNYEILIIKYLRKIIKEDAILGSKLSEYLLRLYTHDEEAKEWLIGLVSGLFALPRDISEKLVNRIQKNGLQ